LAIQTKPFGLWLRSGSYASFDTWNTLRRHDPEVNWWPLVWFPYAIPKHSFVMWLVMKNSLSTGDRLAKWGYMGNVQCLFCRNGMESCEHLFFECSFSARLWKTGIARCNVLNPSTSLQDVIRLGCSKWNKKTMSATLCRLVLCSTVYHLWRNRNDIKHNGISKTEDQLMKLIIWEVRSRILGRGRFKGSHENAMLCQNWNIPLEVLV
jgi:hypothetical protein